MRAAQEKFDNLREGKLEFAKGSVETHLLNAAPALSAHSGFIHILETRQERHVLQDLVTKTLLQAVPGKCPEPDVGLAIKRFLVFTY